MRASPPGASPDAHSSFSALVDSRFEASIRKMPLIMEERAATPFASEVEIQGSAPPPPNPHTASANDSSSVNGPQSIAVPIPNLSHVTLHLQATRFETSNMIFLTTADMSSAGTSSSTLGSFVYSMPNVRPPRIQQPVFSTFVGPSGREMNCPKLTSLSALPTQ